MALLLSRVQSHDSNALYFMLNVSLDIGDRASSSNNSFYTSYVSVASRYMAEASIRHVVSNSKFSDLQCPSSRFYFAFVICIDEDSWCLIMCCSRELLVVIDASLGGTPY